MRANLFGMALLLGALNGSAAPVAENGLLVIGDRGSDAIRGGPPALCRFQLPFTLAAATRVWAEAEGLQGLRGDHASVPEVFLNDVYLGPLRVEHGAHWRSPRAVDLPAGTHTLELRCAEAQDADDVSIQRLRVFSEAPAPSRARPARARASSADCSRLRQRKDRPAALSKGSLILSVLSGRQAASGTLVSLKPGDTWNLLARVPLGPDGKPLALATGLDLSRPGRARLLFLVTPGVEVPVDALGYTPGAWQPLAFRYCGGHLAVDFARGPSLARPSRAKNLKLEIAAQDLELSLKLAGR